ncbi:hypothetical protein MCAP1_002234 [Malassezia caprae]|uniref:Uncharacterized protein n=1 Tax=Malassezia caprae TaxID=1381934 RepID=A0AAF0J0F9_9BASI|nr:hypothetical protein MCAP1_002234 [Malassezia caprae]
MVAGSSRDASKASFQVLRPICVKLLHLTKGALDAPELVSTLRDLLRQLHDLPAPFSPALVHYIFYPLSQLLRVREAGLFALPDRVRELVFQILAVLARDWWSSWTWCHVQQHAPQVTRLEQSTDWKVWEQLLFLGVMALSGGLHTPAHPNSDETRLAILDFLVSLLRPRQSESAETSGDADWEWDGVSDLPLLDEEVDTRQVYPAPQHTAAARDSNACTGALAHLLKMAMDTVRQAQNPVNLRLSALDVASAVALTWMAGCGNVLETGAQDAASLRTRPVDATTVAGAERLRPVLPGLSSSLVKVITSPTSSTIVSRALALLSAMWAICLHDECTASMRMTLTPEDASLPSCLEDFSLMHLGSVDTESPAQPESDPGTETASESGSISTSMTSVEEGQGLSWLEQTIQPVRVAMVAIAHVVERDDANVQYALAVWTHALLACSWDTLTWADEEAVDGVRRILIETLVDLAHRRHADRVVHIARASLQEVGARALPSLQAIMEDSLNTLPAVIRQVQDSAVQRRAYRMATCASVLANELCSDQLQAPQVALLHVLSPEGEVELWAEAWACAVGAHEGTPISLADTMPHVQPSLTQLESSSMVAIGQMWCDMGQSLEQLLYHAVRRGSTPRFKEAFAVPLHMFRLASALRADAQWSASLAHLWATHELLLGASTTWTRADVEAWSSQPTARPLRKTMHSLARHMILEVQSVWQWEAEQPHDPEPSDQDMVRKDPSEEEVHLVRGLPPTQDTPLSVAAGPALDVSFVRHAKLDGPRSAPGSAQLEQRRLALRDQCDAFLLLILGSAASMLGVSCRPLLLHILYPVLSALGRQDETVRHAAQYTLERLSDACAYPTVQSCVLHHTDYILGAASHRLVAGLRMELQAGLAVTSVQPQRSAGALLSARAAPWVLVQVIQMLGVEAVPLVEDSIDEVLTALDHFHGHDDVCDGLLAVLAKLVHVLVPPGRAVQPTIEPPGVSELDAFEAWLAGNDEAANDALAADPGDEDPNPEPDRLQSIVGQILGRCVPFMSHASAQIRTRALHMLADGISLLAPQGCTAELYPVLDRAWPLILARLGKSASTVGRTTESDHRVWCEATALVGVLGEHVPDVYSKKILKDAWPRWQGLLAALQAVRRPPVARVEGQRPDTPARPASKRAVRLLDVHGTLADLLQAVMEALTRLVLAAGARVESAAVWAVLTYPLFLDTLDERQPRAIRAKGVALYASLARADAMATWMALRAAVGASPPWELQSDLALSSDVSMCFTW